MSRNLRDWIIFEIEQARLAYKDPASRSADSILAKFRDSLPEEATETKNLGKDYAGYSRGWNAYRTELLRKLQ